MKECQFQVYFRGIVPLSSYSTFYITIMRLSLPSVPLDHLKLIPTVVIMRLSASFTVVDVHWFWTNTKLLTLSQKKETSTPRGELDVEGVNTRMGYNMGLRMF